MRVYVKRALWSAALGKFQLRPVLPIADRSLERAIAGKRLNDRPTTLVGCLVVPRGETQQKRSEEYKERKYLQNSGGIVKSS